MDIQNILNKWFNFSEYDENQTCFNLLSNEYEYHRANKRVQMLIKEYDTTGSLAVMYVKKIFLDSMKNTSVNLYNILSKPESLNEYKEAWDAFTSDDVVALENNYLSMLFSVIEKAAGKKMIGEMDIDKEREVVFEAINSIMDSIEKLRFEAYQYGGEMKPIKNYSTKISVFPSLAHCVSALEQADDGMYLCYIRLGDTADGYFGYFVKNNGNIFSVNERPNEAYSGQHKRSRNAHWIENKAFNIFPYNIFKFSNYDYKGYSTEHKIDESNLDFFSLGSETYFPVILVMLMLNSKYQKGLPEDKLVYIDSLMKCNFQRAVSETGENNKALIPVTKSSIAKRNQDFDINFTTEDIVLGNLSEKFDHSRNKGAHYEEVGTFPEQTPDSLAQKFINMYGHGFILDTDKLLETDSYKLLLPQSSSDNKDSDITVEFVGNKKRMELEAYRKARAQLADHIKSNMLKEYISYGGAKEATKWWREAVLANKEFIEKLCVELFLDNKVDDIVPPEYDDYSNKKTEGWNYSKSVRLKCKEGMNVVCYPDTRGINPGGCGYFLNNSYRSEDFYMNHIECDYTGSKSSIYFLFTVTHWKTLEHICGKETPSIFKGWGEEHPYSGNSLLDATDAVFRINHPFYEMNRYGFTEYSKADLGKSFNCKFAIAFSKRGFKKLIAKYSK